MSECHPPVEHNAELLAAIFAQAAKGSGRRFGDSELFWRISEICRFRALRDAMEARQAVTLKFWRRGPNSRLQLSEDQRIYARSYAAGLSPKPGHGGDRRSGKRTTESIVLRMAARLYWDLGGRTGFSIDGPLYRFVNLVGELALQKANPFSNNAVNQQWRRLKRELPAYRRANPRAQSGSVLK